MCKDVKMFLKTLSIFAIIAAIVLNNNINKINFSNSVIHCKERISDIDKIICSKKLVMDGIAIITEEMPLVEKLRFYAYLLPIMEKYDGIVIEGVNESFPHYHYGVMWDKEIGKDYLEFMFGKLFPHLEKFMQRRLESYEVASFPKYEEK